MLQFSVPMSKINNETVWVCCAWCMSLAFRLLLWMAPTWIVLQDWPNLLLLHFLYKINGFVTTLTRAAALAVCSFETSFYVLLSSLSLSTPDHNACKAMAWARLFSLGRIDEYLWTVDLSLSFSISVSPSSVSVSRFGFKGEKEPYWNYSEVQIWSAGKSVLHPPQISCSVMFSTGIT